MRAYVNWLVNGDPWTDAWGGPTYDGSNIWENPIWDRLGWRVYENTADFLPLPGDIFSAGKYHYGGYNAHTGVVISSDLYTAVVADSNARNNNPYDGDPVYIHSITWRSSSTDSGYGATHYIRPNFKSGSTTDDRIPNKVTLQNFKRTYTADEDVTFTWDESDPKATHFTLIIDKMENGKYVFYTWDQYAESGVTKRLPVGQYNARIVAYNSNYWEPDGSDWLHADYDYVDFEVTEPKYYFNVQGWLDEQASDNTEGYATFDVYINDELVRDDTTDYYVKHPAGSTYEIRDIKTIGCHAYDGIHYGSISGTVPDNSFSISLSFITSHVWGECVSLGADEHKRVCSNDPSHVEILAHCWDTGSFLVVPTMTTPGVIQFTCTDCGETRMEVVPIIDMTKGDPDGDGKITVSDALKILRVAAKLADASSLV